MPGSRPSSRRRRSTSPACPANRRLPRGSPVGWVHSRHASLHRAPARPRQSRAARVRPDPVLQRRHLRHRDHPADRRPAGARRRPPRVRPAAPGDPPPDRRVRDQLRRDRAVLDGPPRVVPSHQGPGPEAGPAQPAVPRQHRVPALSDRPAERRRRPSAGDRLLRGQHRRRRAGGGRGVAVRDPHPRAGPAWGAAFGAPLGAAADPQDPAGVPVVGPGRDRGRPWPSTCGCSSWSARSCCTCWSRSRRSRPRAWTSPAEAGVPGRLPAPSDDGRVSRSR